MTKNDVKAINRKKLVAFALPMQTTLNAIQSLLMKPEVKKDSTRQIKEKARVSVLDKLKQNKMKVASSDEAAKRKKQKKQDMEL